MRAVDQDLSDNRNHNLRYDSTAVRLLIKGHQGHSDVTRLAAAALTLTYLFI